MEKSPSKSTWKRELTAEDHFFIQGSTGGGGGACAFSEKARIRRPNGAGGGGAVGKRWGRGGWRGGGVRDG